MENTEKILRQYHTIAVVGASPDPTRASHRVFEYLAGHGYEAFPVNPTVRDVGGKVSYRSLSAIPEKVEVVDIFRKSEEVPAIVDEAIKVGAKAIWMQEGVINKAAAAKAEAAGLLVVMDKCMMKEHHRLTD